MGFISPVPPQSSTGAPMKRIFAICAAVAAIGLMASSALAEISTEAARDSVAPVYRALNAEFAKDSPELIKQSTTPQWRSCRGNDICNSRGGGIAAMHRQ